MNAGMDAKGIQRALARMAQEILESNEQVDRLMLVGIHSGGVPLAHRLADLISTTEGRCPLVGEMDITLYRDDLYTGLEKPVLGETRLPTELTPEERSHWEALALLNQAEAKAHSAA